MIDAIEKEINHAYVQAKIQDNIDNTLASAKSVLTGVSPELAKLPEEFWEKVSNHVLFLDWQSEFAEQIKNICIEVLDHKDEFMRLVECNDLQ